MLLYWFYVYPRFNPVFTQVIPSVNKVRQLSLWQAIRSCVLTPPLTPEEAGVDGKDLYTIKELSALAKDNKWGPVVVFPEATTSNGRALLKFGAPLFKEFNPTDRDGRFHVMTFKYEYSYMPPTYTVGYQFVHFLSLCSQVIFVDGQCWNDGLCMILTNTPFFLLLVLQYITGQSPFG